MDLIKRPRRLRRSAWIRKGRRENHLMKKDFIMPLFLHYGKGVKRGIAGMPGMYQYSIDEAIKAYGAWREEGLEIEAILLFGIPKWKDSVGSESVGSGGVVARGIRAFKREFGRDIFIIADVCLCEYTDHGHCGVIRDGEIENDLTLVELGKQAVNFGEAGVDMVAPSGMMDGMVKAIRRGLDLGGYKELGIMSYAIKYGSGLYGPFREAVGSAPSFGDRRSYQMDYGNVREGLLEAELDEGEGADILMVKPGLFYLDIVARLRERTLLPLAVYQVSGEYGLYKAGAAAGVIDYERVIAESLVSIKRAGGDFIISYFTPEVLRWMKGDASWGEAMG